MASRRITSERLFRARYLVIILFGVLGFVLGALYLSLERMAVGHFVLVTGSAEVHPGGPAAIRVTVKDRETKGLLRVQVTAARWSGRGEEAFDLPIEIEGHRPAVVRFAAPAVPDGIGTLELELAIGDRPARRLWVPLQVRAEASLVSGPPERAPPPRVGGPLRVALVPADGVFLFGFDDRFFASVLDPDGRPLAASVTVKLSAKDGRSVTTDETGLGLLPLRAELPRYQSEIQALDASGRRGELRVDLAPTPRGHRMRLRPRVVPPRGRYRLEIEATERQTTLYCDVLRDGRPIDGFSLAVTRGFAAADRTAPAEPGAYALQCAPYVRSTGQTFATRALVVAEAPTLRALAEAVEPQDAQDAVHLAALADVEGSREQEALVADFLAARLVPPYREAAELANTLAADRAVLELERDNVRGKVLIALGIALAALFLWCVAVVGANVYALRRAAEDFAALSNEDAAGGDVDATDESVGATQSRISLHAERGLHHYVVLAVLLVLNVLAVLWLLATIAR